MGKSVARYDGSSAHYVLKRNADLGLSHYQFSRHAFVKFTSFGEYSLNNGNHDSDDRRDGYRYSDGLTRWLNGYMVSQCNND